MVSMHNRVKVESEFVRSSTLYVAEGRAGAPNGSMLVVSCPL